MLLQFNLHHLVQAISQALLTLLLGWKEAGVIIVYCAYCIPAAEILIGGAHKEKCEEINCCVVHEQSQFSNPSQWDSEADFILWVKY